MDHLPLEGDNLDLVLLHALGCDLAANGDLSDGDDDGLSLDLEFQAHLLGVLLGELSARTLLSFFADTLLLLGGLLLGLE